MSDQQEEGDRDLESDEETQEREDEIQQALILESRLTILQRADELAEWTDIFNLYLNYLLLLQHPHDFQFINSATIVGHTRQLVATAAITLITAIELAPGGEHIPRPILPQIPVGVRWDTYTSRLIGQAASPPRWVPVRHGRLDHQDPDPNPAEDSDTSNSEDQTKDRA
jgi:hypothetical protein